MQNYILLFPGETELFLTEMGTEQMFKHVQAACDRRKMAQNNSNGKKSATVLSVCVKDLGGLRQHFFLERISFRKTTIHEKPVYTYRWTQVYTYTDIYSL